MRASFGRRFGSLNRDEMWCGASGRTNATKILSVTSTKLGIVTSRMILLTLSPEGSDPFLTVIHYINPESKEFAFGGKVWTRRTYLPANFRGTSMNPLINPGSSF